MARKKPQPDMKPAPRKDAGGDPAKSLLIDPVIHLLLLFLAGTLLYAGTTNGPFVFDDHTSIVDNPVIKNLGSILSAEGVHATSRRFVGYLTFALNYQFCGLSVRGYHLVNIFIHLCAGASLYLFIRATFRTPVMSVIGSENTVPLVALAASLIFVVHPVQTQAVTYIVQRVASLATLFYLLAMLGYALGRIRQQTTGRPGDALAVCWFLSAAVTGLLAMMTKEIAFTLPLMLVLYELMFFPGSRRRRIAAAAAALTAAVLLSLIAFTGDRSVGTLLSDVSASLTESRHISRTDYLFTQFRVLLTYLRLLVAPVGQNLDYDYPVYHSLFHPSVLAPLLLLLGLAGGAVFLVIRSRREEHRLLRLTAFGIFWFFIALSVESSIVPISDVIFEHRLYLPSAGGTMALVSVGALLAGKVPHLVLSGTFGMIFVALSVLTWQRNSLWQDEVALWQDTVAKSPKKARSHNELGKVLFDRKRYPEAIAEYRTAITLAPGFVPPHSNLGAALMKSGDVDGAIAEYRTALQLAPEQPEIHNNLGTALDRKNFVEEAAAEFREAIRHKRDYAAAHNNLGAVLRKQGNIGEAKIEYETALKLKPEYASPHNNLGILNAIQGKLDEAIASFTTAVQLQPDNPEFRENLAKAYDLKGLHDQAASIRNDLHSRQQVGVPR